MKSKLVLNERTRNHIKFIPVKKDLISSDDMESIYNHISEGERMFLKSNKQKGYKISLWKYNDLYYLVQNIRNEFGTYNTCIYIDDVGDDMFAIAKFIVENIQSIMDDYKDQILEARNDVIRGKYKETDA